MKINKIITTTKQPEVYSPGTSSMWEDEYISKQLLEVHLNQHIDLASRKESTITNTVDWILSNAPNLASEKKLNILDLGCGPGLYTEKLADKGHNVTGVDFSESSINYAKQSALNKGLDITYKHQNYLDLNMVGEFDIVIMIFTDFGALTPQQRQIVMTNIYHALRPGGVYIFDTLNENHTPSIAKEWEITDKGFWSDKPYLVLTESFYYKHENVYLSQHTVIQHGGGINVYRFWTHTFTDNELKQILINNGFVTLQCYKNIIPGCDFYKSKDVTFSVAAK